MALMDCPDCGRRVSDKAEACPGCARPIAGAAALAATAEVASAASSPRSRGSSTVRPKRAAHVVAVPAPIADAQHSAVPTVAAERRTVPTHVVVCVECGEEEILAYRASLSRGYVCIACEHRGLEARARRRSLLHWWPIALLVVLFCCALVGLSWAVAHNKPPKDPVMSSG